MIELILVCVGLGLLAFIFGFCWIKSLKRIAELERNQKIQSEVISKLRKDAASNKEDYDKDLSKAKDALIKLNAKARLYDGMSIDELIKELNK